MLLLPFYSGIIFLNLGYAFTDNFLVNLGRQWIGSFGFAGHEEIVAVTALLVEVQLDIGFPLLEQRNPTLTLRVLVR